MVLASQVTDLGTKWKFGGCKMRKYEVSFRAVVTAEDKDDAVEQAYSILGDLGDNHGNEVKNHVTLATSLTITSVRDEAGEVIEVEEEEEEEQE